MNDYQEQLKNAETTLTITPKPLIMEKVGETFRGMYVGLQSFQKANPQTGELQNLPVAHFYDGTGIVFNMGAQLTRAVSMLKPGISIEIKLIELKPNQKGGKTKIYSVTPLNIPRQSIEDMFGGVLSITAPDPADLLLPPAPVIESNGEDEPHDNGRTEPAQKYAQASLRCDITEFGTMGDQWVTDHAHYAAKDGRLDRFHFLKAAGAEGFQYITNENMIDVFTVVADRDNIKPA